MYIGGESCPNLRADLPTSQLLSEHVLSTVKDLPPPVELDPAELVPVPPQTQVLSGQSSSTQSQKSVPKWLKLGSKPFNNGAIPKIQLMTNHIEK